MRNSLLKNPVDWLYRYRDLSENWIFHNGYHMKWREYTFERNNYEEREMVTWNVKRVIYEEYKSRNFMTKHDFNIKHGFRPRYRFNRSIGRT